MSLPLTVSTVPLRHQLLQAACVPAVSSRACPGGNAELCLSLDLLTQRTCRVCFGMDVTAASTHCAWASVLLMHAINKIPSALLCLGLYAHLASP